LVNALEKRVKEAWTKTIVVNGIRMDEMEIVKSWGAKTIYVTAPMAVRFDRYNNRHEKADDAEMDLEQFKQQEDGPTEVNIPELGAKADFKIENAGSLEDLYKKVDAIIKPMLKSHGNS
jgi:dephospho-CoA kinase